MKNKIGWCDTTINPIVGCSKCSPGCLNCFAADMAHRLSRIPTTPWYQGLTEKHNVAESFHRRTNWTGKVWIADEERIRVMFSRLGKTPKVVFVGSMGDLFHPDVPADTITFIFDWMFHQRQHQYVILTKRPERLDPVLYGEEGRFYLGGGDYLDNVHIGVSVENQEKANERITELVRFKDHSCNAWSVGLSVEPMLGPITIPHLDKIDWVLAGSETGRLARPAKIEWFRSLRDQCKMNEWDPKPFYLKQTGTAQHVDRILDGREWNETAWEVKNG